jgi:hypothetical protein
MNGWGQGLDPYEFPCEICNISIDSVSDVAEHLVTQEHKEALLRTYGEYDEAILEFDATNIVDEIESQCDDTRHHDPWLTSQRKIFQIHKNLYTWLKNDKVI